MKQTYKTIEDDIIEDITEKTLLSLGKTLEADAESTEISEAKVKEEEEDDKMDKVGKEDDDIDNDGDSDEADEYLKNRRKKIDAAIEKQNEDVQLEEAVSWDIIQSMYAKEAIDILVGLGLTAGVAAYAVAKKSIANYIAGKKKDKTAAEEAALLKTAIDKISKDEIASVLVDLIKQVPYKSGKSNSHRKDLIRKYRIRLNTLLTSDEYSQLNDIYDETIREDVDTSDIAQLVESEVGLTEEFKEKATLIFETAVRSKVAEAEATLKEEYTTRLAEEVETIQEDLVEKIDSYLTYAVESWVADNKVAVESTLRTEIAENFITSLKSVFVENYIDVPEGKTDIVAQMETKLSESQEQAEKLERIAESLAEKVETLSRANVLAETSRDLADTQAAKLQSLSEDVQYVDADSFRKKIETLKEFYINSRQIIEEEIDDNSSYISKETIVENETIGETLSPSMKQYLTAISRLNNASTANIAS
jgi:hypothetical protein